MEAAKKEKRYCLMLCARCRHYDPYADCCLQYSRPEDGVCPFFLHDGLERRIGGSDEAINN